MKTLLAAILVPLALIASAGCADAAKADRDDRRKGAVAAEFIPAKHKKHKRKKAVRRTSNPLRAVTHNIAGGAISLGDPSALIAVENQINTFDPHVVMMQEICVSQRDAFQATHPDWHVVWAEGRFSHPGCDGDPSTIDPSKDYDTPGDELGNMIASPYPLTEAEVFPLPHSGFFSREQSLLCTNVLFPSDSVRACTTHIMSRGSAESLAINHGYEDGWYYPDDQIREVVRLLNPYAGQPIVFGGDFNTGPRQVPMGRVYDVDGAGLFQEGDQVQSDGTLCRCGGHTSPTGGSKIDYLFFGGLGRRNVDGTPWGAGYSDHKLFRATGWYS